MNAGDTAWMLMSTALVMIMLPGLALFYGGLVRRKNVLSTIMHSFFGLALVSVVWVIVGFTLAFGPDVNGHGADRRTSTSRCSTASARRHRPSTRVTIPFMLFAMFQLMFAAITPALITGAFAERKRFGSFVLFTILWSILIYSPIAHWVWSTGRLAVQARRARLRRRHGRPHQLRRVGPGRRPDDRPAPHERREQGAARRADDRARRGPAVVRLVRLQRRLRADRGRPRGQRLHGDQHRGRRGDPHVGARQLRAHPQGQRGRGRLRRRRRTRGHHPRLGLRHPRWRAPHRPRRRRPVLQRDPAARPLSCRRRARRLRRPRRRRHVRRHRHRHLRLEHGPGRATPACSTATRSRSASRPSPSPRPSRSPRSAHSSSSRSSTSCSGMRVEPEVEEIGLDLAVHGEAAYQV